MKRIKLCCLVAVALLAIASCVHAQEPRDIPLITVSGTAKIQVTPDSAELEFGVESRATSLADAQANNEQRTKAILEALKKAGVETKDVKSDEIQVEPYYGQDDSKAKPVYFSVSRNINVRLRDISKFETSLTAALKAGATHVRKAEKQSTELRRHKDQARILAARAAQEKAELLAKELGVAVGKPFSIREATTDYYSNARNVSQNNVSSSPTDMTGLSAGMIEISTSVEVSFRIE